MVTTPDGSTTGESSSDKSAKPATNGNGSATSPPQLSGPSKPLGGIPGFPGVPGFPGSFPPPGVENGYRPPFDPHPALRPPLGAPPGGKA